MKPHDATKHWKVSVPVLQRSSDADQLAAPSPCCAAQERWLQQTPAAFEQPVDVIKSINIVILLSGLSRQLSCSLNNELLQSVQLPGTCAAEAAAAAAKAR